MLKPIRANTIVMVLALGIGGHSAVFSIMQAMLIRPPAGVPDDDALVYVQPKQRPRDAYLSVSEAARSWGGGQVPLSHSCE